MIQILLLALVFFVIATVFAMIVFLRNRKVDWKLAMVIDPPTDVMAFIGGYFSALIHESILRGFLAGILMIAGTMMLKKNMRRTPSEIEGGRQWWLW